MSSQNYFLSSGHVLRLFSLLVLSFKTPNYYRKGVGALKKNIFGGKKKRTVSC